MLITISDPGRPLLLSILGFNHLIITVQLCVPFLSNTLLYVQSLAYAGCKVTKSLSALDTIDNFVVRNEHFHQRKGLHGMLCEDGRN